MKIKNSLLMICSFFLITGCSMMNISAKKANPLSTEQNEKKGKEDIIDHQDSLSLKAVYFNNVKSINGIDVIQNTSNIFALVNKTYYLPSDYIPKELVRPLVAFSFGNLSLEKSFLRKEAAFALEKMFADAKKSDIELYAVSGYRSFSRQKKLFNAEIQSYGKERAIQAVAIPGSSEHQTGLAIDISSKSTNFHLTQAFAKSTEGKWLAENAHRFGFILRYPKGKESITHYEFEPWHYRYVGVKAATVMYKHQWTLEEYFNQVKKI